MTSWKGCSRAAHHRTTTGTRPLSSLPCHCSYRPQNPGRRSILRPYRSHRPRSMDGRSIHLSPQPTATGGRGGPFPRVHRSPPVTAAGRILRRWCPGVTRRRIAYTAAARVSYEIRQPGYPCFQALLLGGRRADERRKRQPEIQKATRPECKIRWLGGSAFQGTLGLVGPAIEGKKGAMAELTALGRVSVGGALRHRFSCCPSRLAVRLPPQYTPCGGSRAVVAGTRATLGNVRGGTVSGANGGVERSETVPRPELPRSRL